MPKWFDSGDRGDGVKQLQATLNRDFPAYSMLDERRRFRNVDRSCRPRVQHRAGLTVTGMAGPDTLAELGLT